MRSLGVQELNTVYHVKRLLKYVLSLPPATPVTVETNQKPAGA